ncbi:hypothetical protein F4774DRAFT_427781 [Daldinia eschscholtzii]|nr:hypothetical protein F4774DRAFT_427781 [Daldinia eschscholtzii]
MNRTFQKPDQGAQSSPLTPWQLNQTPAAQKPRRSRSVPWCTHITMTRVFDPDSFCAVCFDRLGLAFAERLRKAQPRPLSPRSRAERFSLFAEATKEDLRRYEPGQILTIISQRDHARTVAQQASGASAPPPGLDFPKGPAPWVPSLSADCRYAYCHKCRPICESKSYLSLDGITKDDIPPTAAIGYGFHCTRYRPIIHPARLRNIGLRAVPWPLANAGGSCTEGSWHSSWNRDWEELSVAEGQEDETEHFEYVEHVEHAEHVEYTEHVDHPKSVRFQFLGDDPATKYTTSKKPTKPKKPNTKGNILPPLFGGLDSTRDNLGFTVSLGRAIPLLPPIREEQEPNLQPPEADSEELVRR